MKRSNIDEKYKWDLTKFYKTNEEWFLDLEKLSSYEKVLVSYKGKLKNPKKLLEFLQLSDEVSVLMEKLAIYAKCNLDVDLKSSVYSEMINLYSSVATNLSSALAFYEPEIISYNPKYLEKLIKNKKFENYAFGLSETLRTKFTVLSEKEEKLLSGVGSFSGEFSSIFSKLTNSNFKFNAVKDSKGKLHELTDSKYSVYLESYDRVLRKNAYETYTNHYKNFSDTISQNFIASVKSKWFFTQTRKFNSVLESSLFYDNINKKVYEKLVDNVNNHLPLSYKYYNIRKKFLGLKTLKNYDYYVPLVEMNMKISFEESIQTIKNALSVLGNEYVSLIDKSVKEKWIDVYANENKRSGGYQISSYFATPLILLNYENRVDDMFTTAHELGHAMHSYYSDNNQPYALAGYTIFLAEIASTFNEVLLLKHLYKNAKSDKEKIYYLENYIRMFDGTIFRQVMFSEFEDYVYELVKENKPISKKVLSDYYADLSAKYKSKSAKPDELSGVGWMRIPHFYRPYYVYKYATGLISAISLASSVYNGVEGAKEKYFTFLKSGGSNYSTEILKNAGVNLEENAPYEAAFAEFEWAINELELLFKKQNKKGVKK